SSILNFCVSRFHVLSFCLSGLHIVQVMTGCQWDDETDEVNGFEQYGYDGEDFLSFDMKTETWIAPRPQAVTIKHRLNNNRGYKVHQNHYFTKECRHWLKKFLDYGENLPSVSLLQKTPSSPLTCHATGFYPDRADLFWKKDEEELHEDVVKGEILPNHDGSFQMSVDLDLSGLKDEDWGRYSCVQNHFTLCSCICRVSRCCCCCWSCCCSAPPDRLHHWTPPPLEQKQSQ
uniref:Ig-like domain-containing protein n=1 Tax=Salarias fasciatus TaxID=181472 RepID=A0A672FT71_SALFA